ncbi:MAG: ferredoxin reductase [Gemmatimonadetes bacterium]|nr:ferredoxin reductase [Gemmatimonadota bacterium]
MSTVSAPARPRAIAWRLASVAEVRAETVTTRTLVLDVPGWPGHRAGQHVDVRLTAEDGYQAQRSYSIASAPETPRLALTVERLEDGEVSPYLTDVLRPGDRLELRGPIGGYFVWDVTLGGPLLLVAGGSGIVPLMAMLRHRAAVLQHADARARHEVPARLLYSARRWDDVIYREELARLAEGDETLEVALTLTREAPRGWTGFRRRIDKMMLAEVAWPPAERPRAFVCGPTPLVEAVAAALVELGHDPARVKTERFGPTGGSA